MFVCLDCTTRYAPGIASCPHCTSVRVRDEDGVVGSVPFSVTVSCSTVGCGAFGVHRDVRLMMPVPGLVHVPRLVCQMCGSDVPLEWSGPDAGDDEMPKISAHSGATDARAADASPAVEASCPPVVAEDGRGALPGEMPVSREPAAVEDVPAPDDVLETDAAGGAGEAAGDSSDAYDGMTLAELREVAVRQGVPSYGSKAQVVERLRIL